jgi:hypothetical protein
LCATVTLASWSVAQARQLLVVRHREYRSADLEPRGGTRRNDFAALAMAAIEKFGSIAIFT